MGIEVRGAGESDVGRGCGVGGWVGGWGVVLGWVRKVRVRWAGEGGGVKAGCCMGECCVRCIRLVCQYACVVRVSAGVCLYIYMFVCVRVCARAYGVCVLWWMGR